MTDWLVRLLPLAGAGGLVQDDLPPWVRALAADTGLLVLAWLLGAAVGWQREASGRAAGLRTHMLVCLGSCLMTLVSVAIGGDPGRIAAQIVSGIGFLGAGVILHRGAAVRGLTTAASIWVVCGIGMAVGTGGLMAGMATVATALTLLTLSFSKRLERALTGSDPLCSLTVSMPAARGMGSLMDALAEAGTTVTACEVVDAMSVTTRAYLVSLRLHAGATQDHVSKALEQRLPEASFSWDDPD